MASLPHYTPEEMALLVKQLEPDSYQDFSSLNPENKRYVGSVVLTGQVGGSSTRELKMGNSEIKRIARDFVSDIKRLTKRLELSEQEKTNLANEQLLRNSNDDNLY